MKKCETLSALGEIYRKEIFFPVGYSSLSRRIYRGAISCFVAQRRFCLWCPWNRSFATTLTWSLLLFSSTTSTTQLGKNIARGDSWWIVAFFFIVLRFYGPHFMRAGNKKIKRKKKKRNCSPSSAKTDSRHQPPTTWDSSLSLWTNRNLVHQSKWEFSITPVDGGMCCPALGNRQTDTNKRNEKEGERGEKKRRANNTSFNFIFIDTLGNVAIPFDGSFARGEWCRSSQQQHRRLVSFCLLSNVHFV